MAFVSLQFDDDQILVAGAKSNARNLQIQCLFSVALTGDDQAAAESLKEKLSQQGLSRSEAIIVISRSDAEIRELVIPPAPDNEVPDMVRFIARNEFASLNDSWALDYLMMSGGPDEQRQVLAIGLSPELQKQTTTIATMAGLKVKHIVLRPFASVDLLQSRLADGACRLIVDPNGNQTDMTIVSGKSVLATRTVRIPMELDANKRSKVLLSEVKRTLASSRKSMGEQSVSQVLMFGDDKSNKHLEGNLHGQLDIDVEFVDPNQLAQVPSGVELPAESQRFAALLGSLIQHNSDSDHQIDFVNPRRPVIVKNDYSKWYMWGGIAVAASLLCVIAGWWVLSGQSSNIADLNKKLASLKKQNEGDSSKQILSVKEVVGEVRKIDQWKTSDVNWLQELGLLSERALTGDDAIVDSLDAVAGLSAGADPKISVIARIDDVAKEKALTDGLEARPYLVVPTRWTDSGDDSYPLSSNLSLEFSAARTAKVKELDAKAIELIQSRVKASQANSDQ